MAHVKIAIKNSLYLFFESGITRIIEFGILVLLVGYLSKDDFGKYTIIITYLTFFAVLIDFGMDSILVRDISREESLSPKMMGAALTFGFAFSLFLMLASYVLFLGFHNVFGYNREAATLILIASPFIIFSSKIKSFRKMIEVMFLVKFEIGIIVVLNIIGRLIFLGAIWWILTHNGTLIMILFAAAFCDFPGFVFVSYKYFKKFPLPIFGWHKSELLSLFKKSYTLLIGAIFLVIKLHIAIFIIEYYLSTDNVADFAAASRFPALLMVIPAALMVSISPILAKKYISNQEAFLNVFGITAKFLIIIAIPLMLYFVFYMEEIIVLVFKAKYFESIIPAQIMMGSLLFYFLYIVLQRALISSDMQNIALVFEASTGVFHIILNFILIPIMGIIGASLAIVISNASFLLIGLYMHRSRMFIRVILKKLPKPIIASTGIIFALYFFPDYFFISIPLGLLLFLGVLYFIKGFDDRDREIFAELIGKAQQ